jgi:hypothetical protein
VSNILKPNFWKIALAIILLGISSALWRTYVVTHNSRRVSLSILLELGACPPEQNCSEFSMLFLLLDVIIWYLIRAFIMQWIKGQSSAA